MIEAGTEARPTSTKNFCRPYLFVILSKAKYL